MDGGFDRLRPRRTRHTAKDYERTHALQGWRSGDRHQRLPTREHRPARRGGRPDKGNHGQDDLDRCNLARPHVQRPAVAGFSAGLRVDRANRALRRRSYAGLQVATLPGCPRRLRAGTSHAGGGVRWERLQISAWPSQTTRCSQTDTSCSLGPSRRSHARPNRRRRQRQRRPCRTSLRTRCLAWCVPWPRQGRPAGGLAEGLGRDSSGRSCLRASPAGSPALRPHTTKGSDAPHCTHPTRGLERQHRSVRSRSSPARVLTLTATKLP